MNGLPNASSEASEVSEANKHRDRFNFQHRWFDAAIRADWEKLTSHLRDKKLQVLEIGCYEGASTTWMLDHLVKHPESSLTVVDTFEGGLEHQQTEKASEYDLSSLENRFWANVSKCQDYKQKLHVMKGNSDDALLALRKENKKFDFIYIDASHTALDVLHDAVLCWRMLNLRGTLVFDDWRWRGFLEDCYNPRIAIQAFLFCAESEIETVETEYQMWITRIESKINPTPNPHPEVYYFDASAGLKLQRG